MFMGWQPWGAGDKGRPNVYRSGTMLTMFSGEGALRLLYGFQNDDELRRPAHIDQALKRFWSKPENHAVAYISPPVGGYYDHVSGCSPEFLTSERKGIWREQFAAPGTRRTHDWLGREKWFCTFTAKGGCDWVGKVDIAVPDEEVLWKTFDARWESASSEPTAGWKWTEYGWQETGRRTRMARSIRQKMKFRHYVDDERQASAFACNPCTMVHTRVGSESPPPQKMSAPLKLSLRSLQYPHAKL